ncbi:hypothetical protein L3Q82_004989 [Scortum barcoo]|uniref:Uncharacterized protein n=1 Tax=Scortum barcoo TaxID=214431 RepID=A0ACB8VDK8_9TELE|nr:hypothetical protein L3Q82_004989 [Scortum barcoo]
MSVLKKSYSPHLETLFINCKPFYSPREFSSFILVGVYIHPRACVTEALQQLADQIRNVEQQHPDSLLIVLGDFNRANLSHELPNYRQHIKCPTRDTNILDHCYTTLKDTYRSVPRAALGLSDHCLVDLIPTYRHKLKSAKPVAPCWNPLQFAYWANRSVDDPVNTGLHYILQHLDSPGTYAWVLFVDFSSVFNTIIPDILHSKLSQLTVPAPTCQWISNFLTDRRQQVRLGSITSSTRTVSTGAPQGCVLSPLLFSLYTNDCTSGDPNVKLLKFADNTTVIGLVWDGNQSAYRWGVEHLALWCGQNNLELNMLKTVEMTVDFRRSPPTLLPLSILNNTVSAVETFRFLGSTISQDLKWESNIDAIRKKAQQRMYFLHQLRKFNLPQELLIQFYTAIIQSVLCTSITVWFGSATKQDRNRLQRTVRTAEKNHHCQPALHSGLVRVQSQETGRT